MLRSCSIFYRLRYFCRLLLLLNKNVPVGFNKFLTTPLPSLQKNWKQNSLFVRICFLIWLKSMFKKFSFSSKVEPEPDLQTQTGQKVPAPQHCSWSALPNIDSIIANHWWIFSLPLFVGRFSRAAAAAVAGWRSPNRRPHQLVAWAGATAEGGPVGGRWDNYQLCRTACQVKCRCFKS